MANVEQFMQELMESAGLSDAEQKKQFEQLFAGNAKIKAKLESTLNSLESASGRASAEAKRAAEADRKAQEYYQESLKKWGEYDTATKAAQAQVQQYVELYGELPGGGNPNNPGARRAAVQDAIDKKTFDERISATEANTIGLVKAAMTITAKHLKAFNEEPDLDAIQEIATKQGLTAMKAYEEWARPKHEARMAEAEKARIEAAREEGRIEERSKRGISAVSDSSPKGSEFMSNWKRSQEPLSARESFLKGWQEPNPKAALESEFGKH